MKSSHFSRCCHEIDIFPWKFPWNYKDFCIFVSGYLAWKYKGGWVNISFFLVLCIANYSWISWLSTRRKMYKAYIRTLWKEESLNECLNSVIQWALNSIFNKWQAVTYTNCVFFASFTINGNHCSQIIHVILCIIIKII